jgi:hypothetical protein
METLVSTKAVLGVLTDNKAEIVETMSATNKVNNKWAKLADKLFSGGLRAYMLDSSDEHKVKEAITLVKDFSVQSFTQAEQKLLATDTKSLDDFGKFQKRKLSNIRDAYPAKIAGHLRKLEDKEDGIVKSQTQKAQEKLAEAIKALEKEEQANYDVVQFIADIKALKKKYPGA